MIYFWGMKEDKKESPYSKIKPIKILKREETHFFKTLNIKLIWQDKFNPGQQKGWGFFLILYFQTGSHLASCKIRIENFLG